jgi:hypothetical protein
VVLRSLADENFTGSIVRGIRRRRPDIDIVRAQDIGLMSAPDPLLLAWAAQEGRVLLTHDVKTITRFAYDRVRANLPMPGVIEVSRDISIGQAIDEVLILLECSDDGEWEGQVLYLPLK